MMDFIGWRMWFLIRLFGKALVLFLPIGCGFQGLHADGLTAART